MIHALRQGSETCKGHCLRLTRNNRSINSTVVLHTNHPYIDFVMSLTPWGMKTGRDAVIQLLSYIGSPQNTLNVFHVTGSNGKWSVCQMISQVLYKQFRKKVGLFTSPHLVDITERFQINGKPISHTKLNTYYKKVLALSKKYTIELSFFEIQVVSMILYFSEENVDYIVVEVGLWWLYDGTNIFDHPLACFITSVTLEHTYLLGKTRTSVLKNKLGIVKEWSTLYTHLQNNIVKKYCQKYWAHLAPVVKTKDTWVITNLPGNHQQKNALLVLQSLQDLWFETEGILNWLTHIYNPGRYEWLSPTLFVDSANTHENVRFLKNMLQGDIRDSIIIFGTTQEESEYAARLANIFPNQKKILVDGFCERALPCSEYSHLVPHSVIWHLDTDEWRDLITNITQQTKKSQQYILYGSIYLVGYTMWLSRYNIFAKH